MISLNKKICPNNEIVWYRQVDTCSSHTVTHQLFVILWVRVKRILGTGIAVMLL